jgi:hypothetical protein
VSPRRAPVLFDPAAQSERTLLAWTRTALAVTAVAAFLLRVTADQQQVSGSTPAGIAATAGFSATAPPPGRSPNAGCSPWPPPR